LRLGDRHAAAGGDPEQPAPRDGAPDGGRHEQRGRRHRDPDRDQRRRAARPAGDPVRARRAIRLEHELHDADRLPDESARLHGRRLQVRGFLPRRHTAPDHPLDRALDRAAGALSVAMSERRGESNMAAGNVQRGFFFALLFLVTLTFLWLIRGFLQPIFWAIALGIVVYPLHERVVDALKGRASLAAATSVLLVVVIVILPLIGLGAAVTREAAPVVERIGTGNLGVQDVYRAFEARLPLVTN